MPIAIVRFLAKAFSKILGTPVLTYDQYKAQSRGSASSSPAQPLDMDRLFHLSYDRQIDMRPAQGDARSAKSDTDEIAVLVETLAGDMHLICIDERDTLRTLKQKIKEVSGIPCDQQKLTFNGTNLDDDHTSISEYGVVYGSILYLITQHLTFIDESLLAPDLDYDFTDVDDGNTEFYRGGERYYRPCGWQRFGIKVMGRYAGQVDGEEDKWVGGLGPPGYRVESTEGEWPVSYHGTMRRNAQGIASSGYLMAKAERSAHGKGIYSAPDIRVAAEFANSFKLDGEMYKLVFQNRVSPQGLKKVNGDIGEYWIQANEKLIRPYNVCVRRV